MIPKYDTLEELRIPTDLINGPFPWRFPSEALARSKDFPSFYLGYYIVKAMNQHHHCYEKYVESQMTVREMGENANWQTTLFAHDGMTKREFKSAIMDIMKQDKERGKQWEVESNEWLAYANSLCKIAGVLFTKPHFSSRVLASWFRTKPIDARDFIVWTCRNLYNDSGRPYTFQSALKATSREYGDCILDPEVTATLNALWEDTRKV